MALTLWVFWIYRGWWIDLTGEDHGALLHELVLYPNRWDAFVHVVTWDTSHVLMPDIQGLVRPAFWLYHAVLGVGLGLDERDRGIVGLLVVVIAASAFRACVRPWASELLAWTGAWSVATIYPGLTLVTWRHIVPYLLGVALLALALRALTASAPFVAGILVLAASLIHESIGIAALVAGAVGALFLRDSAMRRRVLIATLAPGVVAALAQIAVRLGEPTASAHGGGPALSALGWAPWVYGHWVLGWGFPAAFFVQPTIFHRSVTRPVPLPWDVFRVIGAAAFVVHGGLVVAILRRWRRSIVASGDLVILLAGTVPPVLATAFAVVRIPMLSYDYLSLANYYYAIVAYELSLVAVALASRARVVVQRIVAGAFVLVTVTSAQGIRAVLGPFDDDVQAIYQLHHAMVRVFAERRDLCFAGLVDDADRPFFVDVYPFAFLGEPVCSFRSGTSTYLELAEPGFRLVPAREPDAWIPAPELVAGEAVDAAGLARVRVRFSGGAEVDLVASDPTRKIEVGGRGVTTHALVDGASVLREDFRQPQIVGRPDGDHVAELRMMGGRAYARYDGLALATVGLGLPSHVQVKGAILSAEISGAADVLDPAAAIPLGVPRADTMARRLRGSRN